ncbi:actin-binding protein IPP [Arctopsyche grandis]|uniref:actin-binding protein IPP n=1 Tax=Arctopsyche grandis TaxID=121162 RepID=UPI00406D7655
MSVVSPVCPKSFSGNINGSVSTSTSPPETRPYMCKNYSQKLISNLNSLRKSCKLCDIELVSGDVTVKAHRSVLSAGSAYFSAMFSAGLSEDQKRTVALPAIPPQALTIIIDFIYTGQVQLSCNTVQEVLAAADMLQLRDLVSGCCEFLIRELHPSNAVGIFSFAEAHSCAELIQASLEHIYWNFAQVSTEDELLELSAPSLASILQSDFLRVDSESQVLEAALRWIEHQPSERRRHVFEILSNVRLSLLGAPALDQALSYCCDASLRVALRNHRADLVSRKGALVSLTAIPRLRARRRVLLLGGSRREPPHGAHRAADTIFNSVLRFDPETWKWMEVSSMSTGRILPGVATLGGLVYVVGGEHGSQILADGEIYCPETDTWTSMAPMSVARCEFGLTAWRGALYALGGWVGEDIGASVECYDPANSSWTSEGSMPEPRFSMGIVTYDGLIYVVGGCTHAERHLKELLSYNPVTGDWRYLAPMSEARSQAGVAVLEGFLYVVGGNSKTQEVLSSVERYNFDEDAWSIVSSMSVGRASPAVAAIEGMLLVAGGDQAYEASFYRARSTMASVELYDPRSNAWCVAPSLPESRSEAGTAVL